MMEYERKGKKVCCLNDCFANKNNMCRLLVFAIQEECPFYKPVKGNHPYEYYLDKADDDTVRYADMMIEDRQESMQMAKDAVAEYRKEIDNIRRAKKKIKEEREKRAKTALLDSN